MIFLNLKFASPCIIIHFKEINQPNATISQIYYLTFMYSSTCFGYTGPTRVKPEAATAVVELLMMGVRTPETC
jgi:hypothetical protein